jgi:DNA-binding response OmpR family regulator
VSTAVALPVLSLRVLVLNDDRVDGENVVQAIHGWGAEVRVSSDGLAHLPLLLAFRPHVVVFDVQVLSRSGTETSQTIRATRGGASALVILLGCRDDEAHAVADLLVRRFSKPLDFPAIRRLMKGFSRLLDPGHRL